MDTDYNNYSIVWSCEPLGEERSLEYYWLLSRTPSLPEDEELRERIEMLKEQYGIVADELIVTEQFAEGLQVEGFLVKDGNCTLATVNLPYVKDFEVEKYLGQWYELERYEQDYERNMECVSIVYRRGQPADRALEVIYRGYLPYNKTTNSFSGTGVFSEELAQENSNVTTSTTTTVAKMVASFGKSYNATDYWVVDTDYVNYAIVYSCAMYLEMNQAVEGYWLLSRKPNLPNNPQVLDRVKYLRSTYFELSHIRVTNHTEELCPMEPQLPTEPSLVILPPL
uniref:Lipocalin/cytosolic fatty-acid binding domain-containing protein n=1 Tax=Anopheles culicifacies TaxID=139723 RepID=A0A182MS81_9DIPT